MWILKEPLDIRPLGNSRVKTGKATPEMIREVIDMMDKGEIHRPLWTADPYLRTIFNTE